MPGVSKKAPIPYWAGLMDSSGCKTAMELSRLTGIGYSRIYQYIYEGHIPSPENALIIARACKTEAPELLKALYSLRFQEKLQALA